jgi:hypothetical protein
MSKSAPYITITCDGEGCEARIDVKPNDYNYNPIGTMKKVYWCVWQIETINTLTEPNVCKVRRYNFCPECSTKKEKQ